MSTISAGHAQGFLVFRAIQTTVNGIQVHGHSEASFHTVTTTIDKLFKHISQSWHISYFAQGHINYHSQRGELRAQESLKHIYWVAEYVRRKEDMLKMSFQELEQRKSEISEGRMSESEFKLKRQAMRTQLRNGDITNRTYQRKIEAMRPEVEALEKQVWKEEDKFFEAYFPMSLSMSVRESVVWVLDSKKSVV